MMALYCCIQCGARPSSQGEADLIETHELCLPCRETDLETRVGHIRDEIADLTADMSRATEHVLMPARLGLQTLILDRAARMVGELP